MKNISFKSFVRSFSIEVKLFALLCLYTVQKCIFLLHKLRWALTEDEKRQSFTDAQRLYLENWRRKIVIKYWRFNLQKFAEMFSFVWLNISNSFVAVIFAERTTGRKPRGRQWLDSLATLFETETLFLEKVPVLFSCLQ